MLLDIQVCATPRQLVITAMAIMPMARTLTSPRFLSGIALSSISRRSSGLPSATIALSVMTAVTMAI